jgi:sugar (pentulose or hexulose) kinase
MKSSSDSYHQMAALQKALTDRLKTLHEDAAKKSAEDLQQQIDAVETGSKAAPGVGPVNRDLARLLFSVENADMRPAETVRAAVEQSCQTLDKNVARWQELNKQQIPALNQALAKAKLPVMETEAVNVAGCKQ